MHGKPLTTLRRARARVVVPRFWGRLNSSATRWRLMRLSRRLVGARAPGAHGPAGKSLSAMARKVPASCALSGRYTVGASRVQRRGGDLHERQA